MKNVKLKYKGFIGDAQYSKYDKLYYGSILNTNDLVSYEGKNYNELYNDFKDAVNTYIDLCAEVNKLSDPKLFNISKFFIILSMIKQILSKKSLQKKVMNAKAIFLHGKKSCIVFYNKSKQKYQGLINIKNKYINITANSPKEINNKFKEIVNAHKVKKDERKYILLQKRSLDDIGKE